MTGNPSFDQKNQSVKTQTNIYHADQVIVQPSGSAATPFVPQQIRRPPPDFKPTFRTKASNGEYIFLLLILKYEYITH